MDDILNWVKRHPDAAKALLDGKAAVIPLKFGWRNIVVGYDHEIGFTNYYNLHEIRLDR